MPRWRCPTDIMYDNLENSKGSGSYCVCEDGKQTFFPQLAHLPGAFGDKGEANTEVSYAFKYLAAGKETNFTKMFTKKLPLPLLTCRFSTDYVPGRSDAFMFLEPDENDYMLQPTAKLNDDYTSVVTFEPHPHWLHDLYTLETLLIYSVFTLLLVSVIFHPKLFRYFHYDTNFCTTKRTFIFTLIFFNLLEAITLVLTYCYASQMKHTTDYVYFDDVHSTYWWYQALPKYCLLFLAAYTCCVLYAAYKILPKVWHMPTEINFDYTKYFCFRKFLFTFACFLGPALYLAHWLALYDENFLCIPNSAVGGVTKIAVADNSFIMSSLWSTSGNLMIFIFFVILCFFACDIQETPFEKKFRELDKDYYAKKRKYPKLYENAMMGPPTFPMYREPACNIQVIANHHDITRTLTPSAAFRLGKLYELAMKEPASGENMYLSLEDKIVYSDVVLKKYPDLFEAVFDIYGLNEHSWKYFKLPAGLLAIFMEKLYRLFRRMSISLALEGIAFTLCSIFSHCDILHPWLFGWILLGVVAGCTIYRTVSFLVWFTSAEDDRLGQYIGGLVDIFYRLSREENKRWNNGVYVRPPI